MTKTGFGQINSLWQGSWKRLVDLYKSSFFHVAFQHQGDYFVWILEWNSEQHFLEVSDHIPLCRKKQNDSYAYYLYCIFFYLINQRNNMADQLILILTNINSWFDHSHIDSKNNSDKLGNLIDIKLNQVLFNAEISTPIYLDKLLGWW